MASEGGSKVWLLLIGAVAFGVVAALFSALYLNNRAEAIRQRLEGDRLQNVQVVVAAENVPKGTQLGRGAFAVRDMPSEYVHSSVIYPAYFDANKHRFLAEDLEAGKPLLETFLVDEFPIDFSDLIADGLRAITITIDDQGSHAAMLRPGNKIDIFVNVPTRESGLVTPPIDENDVASFIKSPDWMKVVDKVRQIPPSDIVIPVVQDITVLATGREPYQENLDDLNLPQQRQDLRYSTVTIAVSAKQASLIRIAEDKGDLMPFLRNRDDRSLAEFVGVTSSEMFQLATAMAAEAQMRAAAAAAGATIDENGNWVDADGNVMDPESVVVQLPDGRFVDANGKEIPADELVVGPDGTVKTKTQMLAEAGLTVNENGDYVDADGNVISKDDVVVLANGTIMTKDGKILAGPPVTVNEQGFIVAEDGTVMTPDGKVLTGMTVNENGEVVGPDGTVYDAKDLIVDADGTVRTKDGKVLAGVNAGTAESVAASNIASSDPGGSVGLIIGGASEDGVAKVTSLPISQ